MNVHVSTGTSRLFQYAKERTPVLLMMTIAAAWLPVCREEYQSKLFGVGLGAQARVDAAAPQQQNLFERRPKLAVEPSINNRVEETVGVTKPEEQSPQPLWNAIGRIGAECPYEGQYEERQPAGGDRGKDTTVYNIMSTKW